MAMEFDGGRRNEDGEGRRYDGGAFMFKRVGEGVGVDARGSGWRGNGIGGGAGHVGVRSGRLDGDVLDGETLLRGGAREDVVYIAGGDRLQDYFSCKELLEPFEKNVHVRGRAYVANGVRLTSFEGEELGEPAIDFNAIAGKRRIFQNTPRLIEQMDDVILGGAFDVPWNDEIERVKVVETIFRRVGMDSTARPMFDRAVVVAAVAKVMPDSGYLRYLQHSLVSRVMLCEMAVYAYYASGGSPDTVNILPDVPATQLVADLAMYMRATKLGLLSASMLSDCERLYEVVCSIRKSADETPPWVRPMTYKTVGERTLRWGVVFKDQSVVVDDEIDPFLDLEDEFCMVDSDAVYAFQRHVEYLRHAYKDLKAAEIAEVEQRGLRAVLGPIATGCASHMLALEHGVGVEFGVQAHVQFGEFGVLMGDDMLPLPDGGAVIGIDGNVLGTVIDQVFYDFSQFDQLGIDVTFDGTHAVAVTTVDMGVMPTVFGDDEFSADDDEIPGLIQVVDDDDELDGVGLYPIGYSYADFYDEVTGVGSVDELAVDDAVVALFDGDNDIDVDPWEEPFASDEDSGVDDDMYDRALSGVDRYHGDMVSLRKAVGNSDVIRVACRQVKRGKFRGVDYCGHETDYIRDKSESVIAVEKAVEVGVGTVVLSTVHTALGLAFKAAAQIARTGIRDVGCVFLDDFMSMSTTTDGVYYRARSLYESDFGNACGLTTTLGELTCGTFSYPVVVGPGYFLMIGGRSYDGGGKLYVGDLQVPWHEGFRLGKVYVGLYNKHLLPAVVEPNVVGYDPNKFYREFCVGVEHSNPVNLRKVGGRGAPVRLEVVSMSGEASILVDQFGGLVGFVITKVCVNNSNYVGVVETVLGDCVAREYCLRWDPQLVRPLASESGCFSGHGSCDKRVDYVTGLSRWIREGGSVDEYFDV